MSEYMVTFNGNGGVVKGDSTTSTKNGYFDLANVESREGYDFVGWSLYSNVYEKFDILSEPITSNIELYAYWNPIEYTVDFYDEYKNIYNVQYVKYNNKIVKSSVVYRDKTGYDFVGWYTDEQLTNEFSFDTPITSNLNLYPKYKSSVFTVSFYDKESVVTLSSVEVEYGQRVGEPTVPSVEGYEYKGCYTDYDCKIPYDFTTQIYSNIKLYIYMKPIQFTVSFVNEQLASIVDTVVVNYGKSISAPINPTKTGYTFKYWNLNGNKFDFSTSIKSNLTLVAKFEINTYTVTFRYTDYDGKVIDHDEKVEYNNLVSEYKLSPVDGRTFQWWNDVDSNRSEYKHDFTKPITSNIILYAVWEYNKISVKYYRFDNQELIIEVSVDYGSHASASIQVPEKQYFSFSKWINKDGTAFDFSLPIKSDTNIYAEYSNKLTSVRFQPIDGTLILPNQINDVDITEAEKIEYTNSLACSVLLGKPFTTSTSPNMLPTSTKTGYTFDGWYSDSKYLTKYDFNSIITEPVILYARYVKNLYNAIIKCLDDNNTVIPQQIMFGEKCTEPTTPHKSGYAFKRWVDDYGNLFTFNMGITRDIVITAEYIPIGTTDPAILLLSMINSNTYFTGADINAGITGLRSCSIIDIKESAIIVPMNLENILAIYEWSDGIEFDTSKSYMLNFDDSTNKMSYVEKENVYNIPLSVSQINYIMSKLVGNELGVQSLSSTIEYLTDFSEKFPLSND